MMSIAPPPWGSAIRTHTLVEPMSSPTMWVPGRAMSVSPVSVRRHERAERDAVLEPEIDVGAVAEIGGEIVAQRQVAVEVLPEIRVVQPHDRPPLVQVQIQAV